ncbi:tyrosine-protein phosphatase non-receptor type 14 [Periplaneta americana]|uniref:tyrosine-protein phosphatase non-receptor type 14 n=1 Tax=Periplaneta americana TaxID=6978 RepID=UPI0037E97FD3
MPFKLRLKKSRQYNVVSKSLFVICVELLDGTSIECTLSAESSGRECLDNVCQRLGLQQPEFFGLRYLSRHAQSVPRWVEMDRPLKRQLDKYARDQSLFLRVMFYVSGVNLLHDEMTRYHYFLQLKKDVIDGRMNCDAKQAVLLASYSMQAEFGNHDLERHTAEYLKDFALFPKHLTSDGNLENLTEAVILHHAALAGLSQGTAEEYYILAAQQLDGYGQETFEAKDETGAEVIIGVSLMGVVVGYENNQTSKFYRWRDITNVINHKRNFGIECQVPDETVHFQFADPESAKYVWRMCVHQHTFYMQNEHAVEPAQNLHLGEPLVANLFHSALEDGQLTESCEELDSRDSGGGPATWGMPPSAVQRAQSTSCLDLSTPTDMDKLRALLPSYRPAPDYETAMQQKYHSSGQTSGNLNIRPNHQVGILYSSQPEIHQTHVQENLNSYSHYKHYPDVTQVERLYLESRNDESQRLMKGSADHNSHAVLPTLHTYSTPELDTMENHMIQGLQLLHLYKPPPPYPINRPSSNSTPDLASKTLTPPRPTFTNSQVSGSSPDLVSSRSLGPGRHQHHRHHHPHEMNQHQQHPYLDSAVTSHQLLPNPEAHRTYTNLAAVLDTQQPHDMRRAFVTTDEPNIVYCMGGSGDVGLLLENRPRSTTMPYHSVNSISSGSQYTGGASEPIYENVPLPWTTDGRTIGLSGGGDIPGVRSRTSSIQSAPEMCQTQNTEQSIGNNMTMQGFNAENSLAHQHQHLYNSTAEQFSTRNATNRHVAVNHTPPAPHELASFSLPFSGKSKPGIQSGNATSSEHFSEAGQVLMTEATVSNPVVDPGKQKPKRKWGLLVGGKTKSGSNTKNSKSNTLSREKTSEEEAAGNIQHRWSTGLPRLPLPATISKETMCQLLERKLADSQLFFEFERIPKKKTNADFGTALHPDNMGRNRYKDVLPYEENRVRLTPSKENKLGYINASHITATVGDNQRFYIAAQGPLPGTVSSFWQMIWEADVYLVVMLTGAQEEGTTLYCPGLGDRCLEVGEFQVWRQFSQETGHCITTKLRLYHTSSRRVKGVWHLQYLEWGDQGCPHSVGHFLGFLEELNSVRQHTVSEIPAGHNRNPPVLMHCTAGVGRTGVTVLSDLLLYTLDHNQELDIPRVVALLRHQRMLMVQTVAQYRFVYSLLIYYLKHSRLI